MPNHVNALTLAHRFLRENIKEGSFCIDATAGRGGDTLLLAGQRFCRRATTG